MQIQTVKLLLVFLHYRPTLWSLLGNSSVDSDTTDSICNGRVWTVFRACLPRGGLVPRILFRQRANVGAGCPSAARVPRQRAEHPLANPRQVRRQLRAERSSAMPSLPLVTDSRAWNLDILLRAPCLWQSLAQCLYRPRSTGISVSWETTSETCSVFGAYAWFDSGYTFMRQFYGALPEFSPIFYVKVDFAA